MQSDRIGVFDELGRLGVRILRIDLHWGGPSGVALARPEQPTDPNDSAYDWSEYDRTVIAAHRNGIQLLLSIVSTPQWANGGSGVNVAPERAADLRDFTFAAAKRYSGTFTPVSGAVPLPAVRSWLAWNEPNNPVFLSPQYVGRDIVSGRAYARICNAVVLGVDETLLRDEHVACGATAPRGNNDPSSSRPSVSPLAFLHAMKSAGARGFDAYAHHPYYRDRSDTPRSRPDARTAVTLGNFDVLAAAVAAAYGPLRLWITEYGFQTNPPDDIFGVSYAAQASYLRQAFDYAKRHPRIDVFIWFLLRDEPQLGGWQSGLASASGRAKPAWNVFRSLK